MTNIYMIYRRLWWKIYAAVYDVVMYKPRITIFLSLKMRLEENMLCEDTALVNW